MEEALVVVLENTTKTNNMFVSISEKLYLSEWCYLPWILEMYKNGSFKSCIQFNVNNHEGNYDD